RRHFMETTQSELMRQQRKKGQSVIVMIDIDHFKEVNDNYGHAAGDKVIIKVATILKDSSRTYDITGRLGGEEYAIMMVDCDLETASEIAKRLCKELEKQKIDVDGHKIKVTVSVGLSTLSEDDNTIEEVILRADRALYRAKDQGRNRVVSAFERG
ncbi:MAG: diguanylate cyclase (GGDEF)-like protein, partial [Gammaproteobacteria bacterium]